MLRDRLVCGIMDKRIQRRLLAESNLTTYKKAMELALSLEAADQNLQGLDSQKNEQLNVVESAKAIRGMW